MKRMWKFGIGGLALVFAAGCAGTSEARRDAEGAIAGLEESSEGMVASVSEQWGEVQPADDPQGEPIRFERTGETDLVRNEQPMSWPELSEGMPVRVSYESEAGAEQAMRVEVLTGAEADEVREQVQGSSGWSRPEGVGSPPSEGAAPPMGEPGSHMPPPTERPADEGAF